MPNVLFLLDPVDSLSLKKDSTLAMIRAAQRRGWPVSVMEQQDMLLLEERVQGLTRTFKLSDEFAENLDPTKAGNPLNGDWYETGPERQQDLAEFDVVMMRKDPPFNMEFIYSTYLLEKLERQGALVVNKPASIRDCNEKLFATEFPQCCPPLIVSRRMDKLREFHGAHSDVIFKRLDGMGGMSIFRAQPGDPNLSVILETLTNAGREQIMGQKYLPEIVDGDKRILLIDGEPVPYALGSCAPGGRIPGQSGRRRHRPRPGTERARPVDRRADRARTQTPRPAVCRHRCHWRLPNRNQRHLPDLYS